MNDVIFVGPMLIPVQLLFLAAAGIAGYFALAYRLKARGGADEPNPILDRIANALFIGILIWKFSPVVFDTGMVLRHPLSLLYFTGGSTGILLGILFSILYLSYHTKKAGQPFFTYPDAVFTLLLAGGGVYALLLFLFRDGGWLAACAAAIAFGLYFLQIRRRMPLGSKISGNLLTVAVIAGLIGWGIRDNFLKEDRTLSGPVAADFELSTTDGYKVKLSDFRGKKVLLNFWATWCPPCKAEMPHIEKFYQIHEKDGIVVLAVNLTDTESSTERVKAFANDFGLTFPVVLDDKGQVRDLYGVRAYPTSVIIDRNGFIRDKYQGSISYSVMNRAFEDIE